MTIRLTLPIVGALALFAAASSQAQQTAPPARAAPPSTAPANPGALTPAEAQHAIEVLQDPEKRSELVQTLRAIAQAPPPAATPPAAAPPAAAANSPAVSLAPHSLGAQLVAHLSSWPQQMARGAAQTIHAVTDFPLLWGWAAGIAGDPAERIAVLGALWQIVLVMACALLFEWLAGWLLSRSLAALAAGPPPDAERGGAAPRSHRLSDGAWHLLRRLPFALARLALDLIPIGVFWGTGSLLAGIVSTPLAQLAVLEVVEAYATGRVVTSLGRMLLAPGNFRLRLLHIGDDRAVYLMRWLRRITAVAVTGNALAGLAMLFGLNEGAYETLDRAVGLIVAALLVLLVMRSRRAVAQRLRAGPKAAGEAAGEAGRWRDRLAGGWHYLAVLAIIAGWILWAAGIQNGLGGLRLLIGSVAILVAARLVAIVALGLVDRTIRLGADLTGAAGRAARYHAAARAVARALVAAGTAAALLQWWGADAFAWFEPHHIGGKLASALATIAVAVILAIVAWEGANAALERRLARLGAGGPAVHSARLRTLLPLLRAALLCTILAVVGLTALSEIGIDIAPLLAGAGIVGIAVGFGAQKLVQDVITGMFVLFENAIQIGDSVTVAGLSGNVERLSVRNIWLRGGDGALQIIPFSAVTSITNTNRGLGNAMVSITVAYKEDSDRVCEVLRGIAAEMRADEAFAPLILGDLQPWVDSVKAWGVTLAGQIACTDSGRWPVQREFNRRLQKRFQELGIELSDWYAARP
jgi:small-conductance mechanosensitive channel